MAHRLTKVAAATAAATALVAGGYALGTRSDGSAAAAHGAGTLAGPSGWHDHDHRAQALATLAGKLGVSESALRSALQSLRPQRQEARDEHVDALATALGIAPVKVRAALQKLHAARRDAAPHGPWAPGARRHDGARHGGPPGRGAARIAALAKALGLEEAAVRAALQKLRATQPQDAQQRRDAFATALANKLGIDPAKAKSVLGEFAMHRRERRGP